MLYFLAKSKEGNKETKLQKRKKNHKRLENGKQLSSCRFLIEKTYNSWKYIDKLLKVGKTEESM